MKIVVIKSPKFITGILRTIFGIKKEDQKKKGVISHAFFCSVTLHPFPNNNAVYHDGQRQAPLHTLKAKNACNSAIFTVAFSDFMCYNRL